MMEFEIFVFEAAIKTTKNNQRPTKWMKLDFFVFLDCKLGLPPFLTYPQILVFFK